ncbi:MAG: hypothetical protein Q9224_006568, partial [Gallowayella concinna]
IKEVPNSSHVNPSSRLSTVYSCSPIAAAATSTGVIPTSTTTTTTADPIASTIVRVSVIPLLLLWGSIRTTGLKELFLKSRRRIVLSNPAPTAAPSPT